MAKKSKAKLDEVYRNPEFSKRADDLIGVIKHHLVAIKGEKVTNKKVTTIATKIIEERA